MMAINYSFTSYFPSLLLFLLIAVVVIIVVISCLPSELILSIHRILRKYIFGLLFNGKRNTTTIAEVIPLSLLVCAVHKLLKPPPPLHSQTSNDTTTHVSSLSPLG